jgi:hypothetical protein
MIEPTVHSFNTGTPVPDFHTGYLIYHHFNHLYICISAEIFAVPSATSLLSNQVHNSISMKLCFVFPHHTLAAVHIWHCCPVVLRTVCSDHLSLVCQTNPAAINYNIKNPGVSFLSVRIVTSCICLHVTLWFRAFLWMIVTHL